MSITNLTSTDTGNSSGTLILSGEVYVLVQIIDIVNSADGSENQVRKTERRKYDLNNPFEYGAFIEDSGIAFVEEKAAGATTAWQDIKNPNVSTERKQQILDAGKPYPYANTKRLAVVRQENNVFYLVDQNRPVIYEYNYEDACEIIDFDSKVIPGTNRRDANSPCNLRVLPDDTTTTVETFFLSSSFTDFDDYRRGYRSLFQELGFKSGSTSDTFSFDPKRFQFISQSLIIDDFEDVVIGPVRIDEEVIPGERGTSRTDLVIYQSVLRKNKRTSAVVSGSGREVEIYRRTLSQTDESIFVYKKIEDGNIKSVTLYNNTAGIWNGKGKLYNFYTSSNQTVTEKSYKLEVFSGSCEPSKMFSIYYGDFTGHGTTKLSDDRQIYGHSKSVYSMISSLVGNTLTKTLFFTDNSVSRSLALGNQLKALAGTEIATFVNKNFNLAFDPTGYGYVNFVNGLDLIEMSGSDFYYKPGLGATAGPVLLTPVSTAEKIFAIQINPDLLKNAIDEGNFELCLSELSGSILSVKNNSNKVLQLIDSSRQYDIILEGDTQDSNRFKSGFVGQLAYDVVSGSLVNGIHSNASPVVYGKVYPGYGLIVLDADKINNELNFGIVSQSNTDGMNPFRLFTSVSGAAAPTLLRSELFPFNVRQVDAKIVDTVQILLNKNDFNYSTNPSYYANRERSPFFRPAGQTNFADGRLYDGTLRFRQWFYEPITYITSIGLYNDNYELLAIGKISKPIKKSFDESLKLKVNIRY